MHRGIVLEDGRVLHNTPLAGEHVSSLEQFSKGKTVRRHALPKPQRDQILKNATKKQHTGYRNYNLFTNNCEHLVTSAKDLKPRSPQLGSFLAGAGLAVAVLAVTRHPGWALTSFYAGKTVYRKFTGEL
ncbi:MAG: lecithin retinol acyltransferase family protein [Gammaproteobacteria bacterium]|nr:lecithin retinol acyltransferase family protein [Gammaproteobacteria bacterium]